MLAKITNIYPATILISEKRIPCLVLIIVVVFFAAMILFTHAFPSAFAHGGHQPPAADFEGKKASLFVKLDPPVVTDISRPIFITARFFDENTNQNFEEVTYRIFFQKNDIEIPVVIEGGQFGGQGFFYDPEVIAATQKYRERHRQQRLNHLKLMRLALQTMQVTLAITDDDGGDDFEEDEIRAVAIKELEKEDQQQVHSID